MRAAYEKNSDTSHHTLAASNPLTTIDPSSLESVQQYTGCASSLSMELQKTSAKSRNIEYCFDNNPELYHAPLQHTFITTSAVLDILEQQGGYCIGDESVPEYIQQDDIQNNDDIWLDFNCALQ